MFSSHVGVNCCCGDSLGVAMGDWVQMHILLGHSLCLPCLSVILVLWFIYSCVLFPFFPMCFSCFPSLYMALNSLKFLQPQVLYQLTEITGMEHYWPLGLSPGACWHFRSMRNVNPFNGEKWKFCPVSSRKENWLIEMVQHNAWAAAVHVCMMGFWYFAVAVS